MNEKNEIIELQGTGEQAAFSRGELDRMLDIAQSGIDELLADQLEAIK